jgi:hypothetical protein
VYGQVVPAPTVRHTQRAEAPVSILTVITASPPPVRVDVEWLAHERPGDGFAREVALVNVEHGSLLVLLAWPDEPGVSHERDPYRVRFGRAEFVTDARFCVVRLSKSWTPLSIQAVQVRRILWTGSGAFDFQQPSAAETLHLDEASLRALCGPSFKQAG